jgi:hypothetical protein
MPAITEGDLASIISLTEELSIAKVFIPGKELGWEATAMEQAF